MKACETLSLKLQGKRRWSDSLLDVQMCIHVHVTCMYDCTACVVALAKIIKNWLSQAADPQNTARAVIGCYFMQ
jgi:hypothetical protein